MGKMKKLIDTYHANGVSGVVKQIKNKMHGRSDTEVIDITDDYITWLRFANAGMLSRGNYYCFDYALKNIPNDIPIMEIGSFCGLSANILYYYKQKNEKNNKLFTCDKWCLEGVFESQQLPNSDISYAGYSEFVKSSFITNTRMFSPKDIPYTIEMFSDEFFEAWQGMRELKDVHGRQVKLGGEIGFCFVDGNHSYEGIKKDFLNTDKYLIDGGFILFDDSTRSRTDNMGAQRVMQEIIESGRYELVRENPNFFFKKLKSF